MCIRDRIGRLRFLPVARRAGRRRHLGGRGASALVALWTLSHAATSPHLRRGRRVPPGTTLFEKGAGAHRRRSCRAARAGPFHGRLPAETDARPAVERPPRMGGPWISPTALASLVARKPIASRANPAI